MRIRHRDQRFGSPEDQETAGAEAAERRVENATLAFRSEKDEQIPAADQVVPARLGRRRREVLAVEDDPGPNAALHLHAGLGYGI